MQLLFNSIKLSICVQYIFFISSSCYCVVPDEEVNKVMMMDNLLLLLSSPHSFIIRCVNDDEII